MSTPYLGREDAPFGKEVWELLDNAAVSIAKGELAGRKVLPLGGPFGLGFTFVPRGARTLGEGVAVVEGQPLVALERTFHLKKVDIAQFERGGVTLDIAPLVQAVREVVRLEDRLIFEGVGNMKGLCTADGVQKSSLSSWDEPGKAAEDIIEAVSLLDAQGFHGPFALVLAPGRYNLLLRRYPGTAQSELEHIRSIVGDRVVKAPYFAEGGVLLAVNPLYARIVLGQDLAVGFIGPESDGYLFSVSESLALLLLEPRSVCVLE
ncbi:MAG: bacteriocin family protein [Candidatus Caldatribacterium sp.]|nr:bacteriocin family protein [Candidatus Caldatribacterium sp.]